jgi:hypothetical protein
MQQFLESVKDQGQEHLLSVRRQLLGMAGLRLGAEENRKSETKQN